MKQSIEQARKYAEELKKIAELNKSKSVKRGVDDEGLVGRVARKLKELYYGPRTYSKKKFKPSGRTKKVMSGLKQAGLTEKEIGRLK